MNDLGWTLAWLSAQVALVLVPVLGLQAMASRRGPSTGAWSASLGLGMVVLLGVLAFLPRFEREVGEPARRTSVRFREAAPTAMPGPVRDVPNRPTVGASPFFDRFRLDWSGLERRVSEPVARFRAWGSAVAILTLVGSGVGLGRLLVGLWAVGLCRRRGRIVEDPVMIGLVEELRASMGCKRAVEIREVPDLTTPATAGWTRPMLLLPGDWVEWDESERRAVIAHELAHILRGDYVSGLLARLAVVMHYYHPMVRWLARRLHLEQELAADAMAARFAGGRSSYLLALSRLALKQDGRSPSWPARAFLPARGTLIRRIKMLRNENPSIDSGRSRSKRLATALGLLALTFGVASWKAPARAEDHKIGTIDASQVKVVQRGQPDPTAIEPFETRYLPDRMSGVVAFRPALLAKRLGMDLLNSTLRSEVGVDLPTLAKQLGIDMWRPEFVWLGVEDIESVVSGFRLGTPPGGPKNAEGERMHSLEFGGVTVRTARPFAWPAFFRQWSLELDEVREARGVYYRVKDKEKAEILMGCVFYQPDDRTLVFEGEARVKELMTRESPSMPAYLQGEDWARANRGLAALALNNQGDSFAKNLDLGRADDKVALQLFQGIERWVLGVGDSDPMSLRAEAEGRDPQAAEALERTVGAFVVLARTALNSAPEAAGTQDRAVAIYKSFLKNLNFTHQGHSLTLSDVGFLTFADLADLIKAQLAEEQPEMAKTRETKAGSKPEKR